MFKTISLGIKRLAAKKLASISFISKPKDEVLSLYETTPPFKLLCRSEERRVGKEC